MLYSWSRLGRSLVFASVLGLTFSQGACAGSRGEGGEADESSQAASSGPAPLRSGELSGTLDRARLRATNPDIDDAAFALKWDAARSDALAFFRSFDAAYHADLAGVPAARVPGDETLCAGDAHPENFGFMKLPSGTRFGLNDFDDAGYCPAAFDAARFFTAVTLAYDDDALTARVLERYVDVLKDGSRAVSVDGSLDPSWKKRRDKQLAKYTQGDAFLLGGDTELSQPDSGERAAVTSLVGSDSRLSGAIVRDVADYQRTSGGSGGLRRVWVLVDMGSTRTILELKELTAPGVTWGRHTRVLDGTTRFDTLKRTFWGDADPGDDFEIALEGVRFMLRDRMLRDAPNLEDLGKDELSDLLEAEASDLAARHTAAFSQVKKDPLRTWLSGTAATLAARWKDAWKSANGG